MKPEQVPVCPECPHPAHAPGMCEVDCDVPDERYKGGFVAVLCGCLGDPSEPEAA